MVPGARITPMTSYQLEIATVRAGDLVAVIRMTHENMIGVDREFTRLVSHRVGRWLSYLMLPINLLFEGYGFKVIYQGKMVGCAYLNLRKRSGYAYNVSVLHPYRRHGAGGLLMKHLEEVSLDNGRHWMALQVDEGNIPAINLYNSLGYKAYHPRYFGGTIRDLILTDEIDSVSLERLPPSTGKRLFTYYLDIERVEGDPWASYVIDDLLPVQNLEGSYLRCLVDDEEIGCIRWTKKDRHLQIEIALKSDQWGNRAAPNAISKILGELAGPLSSVNVNLGSSRHHNAGKERFEKMGFRERTGARFFMLKRIERRE
jgi:GNAT superfamily N-acetyltransferase